MFEIMKRLLRLFRQVTSQRSVLIMIWVKIKQDMMLHVRLKKPFEMESFRLLRWLFIAQILLGVFESCRLSTLLIGSYANSPMN